MIKSSLLVLRTIRLGLKNLRVHILRSFLTTLGIVFGVCSVISMLSIVEGASEEALRQIRELGSQNIIIQSLKPPRDGATSGGRRSRFQALDFGLRYKDAELIHDTLPSVRVVVPIKAISMEVRRGERAEQINVLGTVPWYPESTNLEVSEGSFFSQLDVHRATNVCVIGGKTARELFRFEDPIGQSLTVGRNPFRIIGILKESGGASIGGEGEDLPSQNADVLVPLTTLQAYEGDLFFQVQSGGSQSEYVELHELIVTTNSVDQVIATASLVEGILKRSHPVEDYRVIVPLRLLEQAQRTQAIFSIVLGSIAAISLLVGGIGIMNIMLASVSERTREIGIRRALGARQSDIMLLFLVECLILSVGGGLIGMGLGAAIPWIVTRFSQMPTVLTPQAFIVSFVVSAAVGVVFGLYPARRAALMDPIDALRHE